MIELGGGMTCLAGVAVSVRRTALQIFDDAKKSFGHIEILVAFI